MRNRNEGPWDEGRGGKSDADVNDPNRTIPLDGDPTEVLSDQRSQQIDEDRTEVLDGGRTEVLSTDDQRTQILDHGSWGSSAAEDPNVTRPLPSYGEATTSPTAQRSSGLEYDDQASVPQSGPREFTPTEYPGSGSSQARQTAVPPGGPGQPGGYAGQAQAPSGADLRAMVVRRQKAEYGRLQLLPGLLGWLVAMTLIGFLTWIVGAVAPSAAGTSVPAHVGDSMQNLVQGSGNGAVWGAVFGVIFFVSYVAGGYAAGRAGRFSGVKQGVAVWLWQLMGTAVTTVLTLFLADRMGNSVPLGSVQSLGGSDFMWGLAAAVSALIVGLIGAILGGLWGTRFHRAVDRWGFEGR